MRIEYLAFYLLTKQTSFHKFNESRNHNMEKQADEINGLHNSVALETTGTSEQTNVKAVGGKGKTEEKSIKRKWQ